jgi:hypothetical protein
MTTQPIRNQKNKKTSIDWTDGDIEQMSQISHTDLKTAMAMWQQDVPARYKDVLNAEVIEHDNTTTL